MRLRREQFINPKEPSKLSGVQDYDKLDVKVEARRKDLEKDQEERRKEREKDLKKRLKEYEDRKAEQLRLSNPPGTPSNAESPGTPLNAESPGTPLNADFQLTISRLEALELHTVGLSISGGGIRSGTFAVGFLQGLAQLRLLSRIDYLSTVSGGGYAGAWLAAWLKREGNVLDVERQLDPSRVRNAKADRVLLQGSQVVDEEPEPLHHLREYSSYLTPRPGIMTTDTWTILSIWLRNVAINMLVLLPMALMLVLLARIVVKLYILFNPPSLDADPISNWFSMGMAGFGLLLVIWAFIGSSRALSEFREGEKNAVGTPEGHARDRPSSIKKKAVRWVLCLMFGMLLVTIPLRHVMWSIGSYFEGATGGERWTTNFLVNSITDYISANLGLLSLPTVLAHSLVFGVLMATVACLRYHKWITLLVLVGAAAVATSLALARPDGLPPGLAIAAVFVGLLLLVTLAIFFTCVVLKLNRPFGAYVHAAFWAGLTGGALICCLAYLLRILESQAYHGLTATIVPPLGVLIYVVSIMVEVALLSRYVNEAEREWWARLSAMLMIGSFSWLGVMAAILYVPALFLWAGPVVKALLASGWVVTTIIGVISGRRATLQKPDDKGGVSLTLIALVMPPIFLAGLLGLISLVVAYVVNMPPLAMPAEGDNWSALDRYMVGVAGSSLFLMVSYLVASAIFYLIANATIDVNLFSLHAMYANRLVRCYIGASRPKSRWQARWGGNHTPEMGGGAPALRKSEGSAAKGGNPDPLQKESDPPPGETGSHRRRRVRGEIADLHARQVRLTKSISSLRKKIEDLNEQRTATPSLDATLGRQVEESARQLYWQTTNLLEVLDRLSARLEPGPEQDRVEFERRKREADLISSQVQQPPSNPNPVTGFDPRDDISLYDLRIGRRSKNASVYWGPHLLINGAMNLVAGQELAWQDRKSESFVMTPLHCGSKGVGYADVTEATTSNLTLGRAITISGAAIDPNMSFYQSSGLTALLTIFNARLGYWMQNPRFAGWTAEGPRFGDRLSAELLGQTSDRDQYVHLSDGGHFENLGIYELIRRRCRYIIAVDSGEDVDAASDNLANLVRLCRIDFGIRVELDTDPLKAQGPDRLSRTHLVIGRVHYEDVDNGQVPGIIVYIKISLTGDEPSDVEKYASKAPRFPHQPTDFRQSFTEEQFESYRALGDHIARDVFSDAVARLRESDEPDFKTEWLKPEDENMYIRGNQRFFSALRGRWASPPADHGELYLTSTSEWSRLQTQLRTEPDLAGLSRDLYPELNLEAAVVPRPQAGDGDRLRAELHAVAQMLQIMENAWVGLGLKGHYDMPIDRGWMNVFRRWSATKAFLRSWPILRPEFNPDFVIFCESQLHLSTGRWPWLISLDRETDKDAMSFNTRSVAWLSEEFRREWPDEAWNQVRNARRDLPALIDRTRDSHDNPVESSADFISSSLIVQGPAGEKPAIASDDRFACGIVVVCHSPEIIPTQLRGLNPSDLLELFVWIRRAHRSIGLGSRCIRQILGKLDKLGSTKTLMVRYPKPDRKTDRDLEMAMWKSFYSLYDFKPLSPAKDETKVPPEEENQTILYRKIGGKSQGGTK
ncbi:patatin-like phospholipase family protein [Singulisphaera sp. PoT]|uniref:patatin-like phospholipase family protein n=1 Tax=Singulisphaera sp. PoT TaxID=3411797 RepID=UPI003BF584BC